MSGGYLLRPGYSRVPVREWMPDLYHLPDAAIVRSADGLQEWTVGALRALARKGQAIDVPHVLPMQGTIWEVGG